MDAIETAEQPEIRARVDIETKEALETLARLNDRSLTSEIRRVLRLHAKSLVLYDTKR
jgi:uncharacterized protein (DUF1778 family)